MIKYLSLTILLILASCSSGKISKAPEIEVPPTALEPIEVESPGTVTILEVKSFKGTDAEKVRTLKAVNRIRATAQTECFKKGLLGINLIQTNGLTKDQVLEKILTADVKINVEMYYSIKNVVGYTYPSSDTIWLNRKYHSKWDACDVGANIFHEATHKMGFTHDYKPNKDRPRSVPYATGTVMDNCCVEEK